MNTAEVLVEKFSYDSPKFDFLSPERQEKYELILHLVANFGQPVFLSGPEGIGKSAFLTQLRDHPPPGWEIFLLAASPEATLDEVQKTLAEINGIRREGRQVVALDDAGCLAPGLLDQICRLLVQDLGFGLVAALRPDELHLKAVSDPWAVGEAQVIELPPLNAQQCADYFERLWLKRGRSGEPDPELVQEIYRRTHGVPGWIQEEALEFFGRPAPRWHLALAKPIYLALAVVGGAVIAVTAYWQQKVSPPEAPVAEQPVASAPKPQAPLASPVVSPPPAPLPQAEVSPPQPPKVEENAVQVASDAGAQALSLPPVQTPKTEEKPLLPAEKLKAQPKPLQVAEAVKPQPPYPPPPAREAEAPKGEEKLRPQPPAPKVPPATPESPKADSQKPENLPPREAEEVAKAAGVQSREWVLKRPAEQFALQIGFFQDPKALAAFARRHPGLRPLAYYPKGKGYVLLYGAFSNLDEVQRAIRKLPPEVSHASIWRFKSVQEAARKLQEN